MVFFTVDNNGVSVLKAGLALDGSNTGSAHEHLHTLAQLLNDSLFALKHRCIVKSHLAGLHAPHLGFTHQVDDLGIAAKGLGGDTAAVQAGASHLVTLDDGDVQAVSGSISCGLVTARPCAYDNNVKHSQ